MNVLEEDSLKLFKFLTNRNVRYILVGGLAVNYYGYTRSTGDVDLWIEDTFENRKKFVGALEDYGIAGADVFMNIPFVAGYTEIMLDDGVYLDTMSKLKQFSNVDFHQCYNLSETWEPEEGITIHVLHINQLIKEKETNGRLKDLDDAEKLKEIRKIKGNDS